MKNLFFTIILGSLLILSSCNKDDKKETKYRIEASASSIESLTFQCRDEDPTQIPSPYNQPTWSKEWVGYNSNEIMVVIAHQDQSGRIKLYVDDELIQEETTQGIAQATTLKFEN
ncbi:MAG: hypothetical protein V4622_12940 [Bacteroidota bacterium]